MNREQFAQEEQIARDVIKHKYPYAAEEGIDYWLNRWWNAKLPIISAMGDIRISTKVETEDNTGEEPEDDKSSDDTESRQALFEKFWNHLKSADTLPVEFVVRMQPNLLSNFIKQKDSINPEARIVGESYTSVVAPLNPDVDLRKFILIKAGEEGIIPNGTPEDFTTGENYRYVLLQGILQFIFLNTPVDLLLQNKLTTGMKVTKFLNTMFSDVIFKAKNGRAYWEEFNILWSQFIQEYKASEFVILSAAPIDYLTMSVTKSWTSCHSFVSGCHLLGGPAYAVDPMTLIGYTPGSGLCAEFGVEFDNKTWRQVVHIDLPNGAAVFGRQYPNTNNNNARSLRLLTNYMLADHHHVERKWKKANGCGHVESNNGTSFVYAETGGPHTRLKALDIMPSGRYGTSVMHCIKCGIRLSGSRSWLCGPCSNGRITRNLYAEGAVNQGTEAVRPTIQRGGYPEPDDDMDWCCPICGNGGLSADDMIWDPCDEEWICNSCFNEDRFECSYCGVRDTLDSRTYIEDEDISVCGNCLDDNYSYCNRCNGWFSNDRTVFVDSDDETWCTDCFDSAGFSCISCGETMSSRFTFMAYGDAYCESCFDDRYSHCEDCGDVMYVEDSIETYDSCYICDNCANSNYTRCERCNDLYPDRMIVQHEDMIRGIQYDYCRECYEHLQSQEEAI